MKKIKHIFQKMLLAILAIVGFSQQANAQCAAGQAEVFIDVITDGYGYEAYWELVPLGAGCGTAATIFSGGNTAVGCAGGAAQAQTSGGYGDNVTTTEPQTATGFCLTIGTTYQIIAVDDYGDGGTCFSSNGQGFNFCMPTTNATGNDTFTFTVQTPIEDLGVTAHNGEYTIIPLAQASTMSLEAAVENIGASNAVDAVLTANIYLGGSLVTSVSSLPSAVNAGAAAVLTAGSYLPTALGDYRVEYVVSTVLLADVNTTNDTIVYEFSIDDHAYARDNNVSTGSLGIGAGDGYLGQNFDLINSADMDSVMIFIQNGLAGNSMVGQPLHVTIWNTTGATNTPNAVLGSSDTITITTTGPHWVNLPIAGGLNLAAGTYYVAAVEGDSNVTVGTTPAIFTPGAGWVNWSTNPNGAWSNSEDFNFNVAYMIRPFLGVPCPTLSSTSTTTDATCGLADGTATVVPSGGTGSYTYLWSANAASQTTATATNLMAGTYMLTFTDSLGCEGMDTVMVVNPNAPTATATVTSTYNGSDVSCNGSTDGEATVVALVGTAPYTYEWDASAASQTTAIATGLGAGTYTATVTDAASCVTTTSVTVVEPTAVVIVVDTITNVSCNGAADGTIMTTTTGGTGAVYTYAWSNSEVTEDISNLAAGTYTGAATDVNGCLSVVTGTIIEPTAVLASVLDNGDGTATASATGGVASYTYLWDAAASGQTTATATGLTNNTTYGVTVTDANGCANDTTVTVVIVGISNISNLNGLSMFPNPTNANVFVELDLAQSSEVVIRVTNTIGQVVLENKLGATQSRRVELNTKDLSTGVYMVQFVINGQTVTEKLVVDKK
jgi:hypothetical protein